MIGINSAPCDTLFLGLGVSLPFDYTLSLQLSHVINDGGTMRALLKCLIEVVGLWDWSGRCGTSNRDRLISCRDTLDR